MPDPFGLSTEIIYALFAAVGALVNATQVKIRSGTQGLLFTLGKVSPRTPLEPGLHLLIPFVQRVRRAPTRSRTLDLPAQRVATHQGYVFVVDANVVFRIVDVRKALIEVDDLLRGMRQMLTLGVQEVVREADVEALKSHTGLDGALKANLDVRLAPWGVVVERAGFPSISPSERTLRITQLRQNAIERARQVRTLSSPGAGGRVLSLPSALGAVGTRRVFRTKARARRRRAASHRAGLRLRAALERRGWSGSAVRRALLALKDRGA